MVLTFGLKQDALGIVYAKLTLLSFSLFLPLFRLYPVRVMMYLEAFVGKLAYQEKHTTTASKMTVST